MKKIIQEIIIGVVSLYLTSLLLTGLHVEGGFQTFLIGGLFLAIGEYILKPVIGLITLPFNVLTVGLFSSLSNLAILYLITNLYPNIRIEAFQFNEISFYGFSVPNFYASIILSYILISATIYVIRKISLWIFSK